MTRAKIKRARPTRQFTLDFITPLQLEACLVRIQQQPSHARLQIKTLPTKDADMQRFVATFLYKFGNKLHCKGVLTRWQGTLTRVEGSIEMPNLKLTDTLIWPIGGFLIYFAMLVVVGWASFTYNSGAVTNFFGFGLVSCAPFVFLLGAFIFMEQLFTLRLYLIRWRFQRALRQLFVAEG